MKKRAANPKKFKKKVIINILIIITMLVLAAYFFYFGGNITGKATGITLGSPKSIGMTSSQSITVGSDITKKLCAGAYTTEAAALITSSVNKYNGGIKGAIMDGLGVPSTELPDIYGILASVADWFNQNPSTKCLKDIGKANCGKDWIGMLYVTFNKGKGSYLYPDWEYYYEKVRYAGGGINCEADLGCAFSYNPKTRDISKSCFG